MREANVKNSYPSCLEILVRRRYVPSLPTGGKELEFPISAYFNFLMKKKNSSEKFLDPHRTIYRKNDGKDCYSAKKMFLFQSFRH